MVSDLDLTYTGTQQPDIGECDADTGRRLSPYLADESLIESVNLAIYLERPLLLKGEPGCGKTQLAWSVKYELGLPLEEWHIKSTSRARDGLYTYDAVGRLRDAQLANQAIDPEAAQRASEPAQYVEFGPLGQAFINTQRTIVLIDEIDKADIDFPNDLLLELEERRFKVNETRKMIRATAPPIVFITSNDEKDLPDAFLRRCLFHYVKFPDRERLIQIIHATYPGSDSTLTEKAVERFIELRELMRDEAGKKVSTSELLDWVRVLQRYPTDQALAQLEKKLPFRGVLLKNWEHHLKYLREP
ncbi:MAG: MoxR family ATPase [Cyanobacteria bacterium J06648_10]